LKGHVVLALKIFRWSPDIMASRLNSEWWWCSKPDENALLNSMSWVKWVVCQLEKWTVKLCLDHTIAIYETEICSSAEFPT